MQYLDSAAVVDDAYGQVSLGNQLGGDGKHYSCTNFNDNDLEGGSNLYTKLPEKYSWIKVANEKLTDALKLPDNWDGPGSGQPSRLAVQNAREILKYLHVANMVPNDIGPSGGDGVAFIFDRSDKYGTIECYNSGETIAAFTNFTDRKIWAVGDSDKEIKETIILLSIFLA